MVEIHKLVCQGLRAKPEINIRGTYLPADLTNMQHTLKVTWYMLEYEVLLAIAAATHGAGVVLLAVHVEVALAGRQRHELQAALSAPVVAARAVRALMEEQLLEGLESGERDNQSSH